MLIISILIAIATVVITTTKEKDKQSGSNHTRPIEVQSVVPQRVLCRDNTPRTYSEGTTW